MATSETPSRHLVFSPASALGAVIQAMLKKKPQPLFLQESFESPLASALKSMAEDRVGVAWVPEILVRKDQVHVVRARETYPDLIRGEDIPAGL